MDVESLLALSVEKNASDLHLSEGLCPILRIDGALVTVDDAPVFAFQSFAHLLKPDQLEEFQANLELDFALSLPYVGRFRVNVFKHDRGISVAFRVIPPKKFSIEELGLPPINMDW
jgi:twitching motility protein PilT